MLVTWTNDQLQYAILFGWRKTHVDPSLPKKPDSDGKTPPCHGWLGATQLSGT